MGLTEKERKIIDTEYEKHKRDNICPHTTNPLQLKSLCKRCRILDSFGINVYQMPQGDFGCSVTLKGNGIIGSGVMSDGFKCRKDAEDWAMKQVVSLQGKSDRGGENEIY